MPRKRLAAVAYSVASLPVMKYNFLNMEPFYHSARFRIPCPFSQMVGCPQRSAVVVFGRSPHESVYFRISLSTRPSSPFQLRRLELEWTSGIDADQPQVFRQISPPDDSRRVMPVRCGNYAQLAPGKFFVRVHGVTCHLTCFTTRKNESSALNKKFGLCEMATAKMKFLRRVGLWWRKIIFPATSLASRI